MFFFYRLKILFVPQHCCFVFLKRIDSKNWILVQFMNVLNKMNHCTTKMTISVFVHLLELLDRSSAVYQFVVVQYMTSLFQHNVLVCFSIMYLFVLVQFISLFQYNVLVCSSTMYQFVLVQCTNLLNCNVLLCSSTMYQFVQVQ